jgi:hypothetical protein
MKTKHIYVTILFLAINSISYAQEGGGKGEEEEQCTEQPPTIEYSKCFSSIQKIEIDAKNGQITTTNTKGKNVEIDFVKKGNRVEVHVINLASNQQPVMTVVQEDVRIEGDHPTAPINPDDFNVETDDSESLDEILEEKENLEVKDKGPTKLTPEEDNKLDSLKLKVLKISMASSLKEYSSEAVYLTGETEKEEFIKRVDEKVNAFYVEFKALNNRNGTVDYLKVNDLFDKFILFKMKVDRLTFDRYFYFTPEKEKVKVNVELNTTMGTTTDKESLYTADFITRRRAILYGSVGMHGLFYGGNSSRIYSNKDSVIVSGKGSSITPSFGTYLNIAWRGNDFMGGFGIGSGIPFNIDGSTDLTPNFSLFATVVFPGAGGRMGLNAGLAMRRGNALAPGYSVGENLGGPAVEVPMIHKWNAAFMFGVTYNLIKQ